MTNRVLFTQANRIPVSDGGAGAQANFYLSGTDTQVAVYSDIGLASQRAQPVLANSVGVFPECYAASAAALRVLIRDADGIAIPGYPIDSIIPVSASAAGASQIAFSPTEALPYNTTQAAIEGAAALATSQTAVFQRAATALTTGGTSNAYTITPSPAITAYGTFQAFTILADRGNTGTSTLNVNGLGTRPLRKKDRTLATVELVDGDINAGIHYNVVFDGTQFIVTSSAISAQGSGYIRWRNGWQWTTNLVTVSKLDANRLSGTLTYAAAFSAQPYPAVTLPVLDASYTNISDKTVIGPMLCTTATTTGSVIVHRVYGAPAWTDGAAIILSVASIGRWF